MTTSFATEEPSSEVFPKPSFVHLLEMYYAEITHIEDTAWYPPLKKDAWDLSKLSAEGRDAVNTRLLSMITEWDAVLADADFDELESRELFYKRIIAAEIVGEPRHLNKPHPSEPYVLNVSVIRDACEEVVMVEFGAFETWSFNKAASVIYTACFDGGKA
ncbi:MAG: hypothetical protein RLY61_181 [Candidatus Parcubacteria bacterium]|jgi:hypothetical protein